MTTTSFTSADVQTRKAWSDRVYNDIITDTELVSDMLSDGILKEEKDLSKNKGDTVKFHFRRRISAKGFIGDAVATGLEQALVYDQDEVVINQLRQVESIPNKGTISEQRVVFNMPEDAYMALKDYIQERMVVSAFNQLCGNSATSLTYDGQTYTGNDRLEITGMNSAVAPSANQIIYAGTANTTDALVNADTSATMSLKYIDEAVTRARKNRPYIRPISGKPYKYVCYVHVDGFKQIVQDTTAPIQFRDLFYSNMAGGKGDKGFNNMSLQYMDTLIVSTDKIPNGVSSSTSQANVRRAVFVGEEAGVLAFGKGYTAGGKTTPGFSFQEDTVDVEQIRRIAISSIFGITKATYNSVDRGTIVISHYVA
jgi:N4-gp56 family major capsid protein